MDTETLPDTSGTQLDKARAFLSSTQENFSVHPFQPHPMFAGGHAQTLAAYIWPRSFRPINDEERLFDVAADVKVVGRCRWQKNRTENPTVVMWHGIEGSTESTYMISMAEKLYAEGFSVIRMNLRTCGGTEHLASTLYHGGLTHDLREVVHELIDKDHLPRLLLMGFSLGGNMVLKLAGEYGDSPPKEVISTSAPVSPVNRSSCQCRADYQTLKLDLPSRLCLPVEKTVAHKTSTLSGAVQHHRPRFGAHPSRI